MKIAFTFNDDVFFTDKERLSEFDRGVLLKELTDEEYNMFAQARSDGDFVFNEGTDIFIVKRNYNFLNPVLDKKNKICIEGTTLEEQKNYYLNKSLEIGKKLEEYKNIGLQGGQEYIDLEKELEVNKNKYIEICQMEAIKIDERINSTKPAK